MDIVSKEARSKNMAAIKPANTFPELMLRKLLHKLGYRYSLHKNKLPGKPDIYLKKYNTLILMNGCFWHQHKDCKDAEVPKSNINFWVEKLKRNAERDKKNIKTLRKMGYNVLTFWQCEIVDKGKKTVKIQTITDKLKRGLVPANNKFYLNEK